MQERKLFDVGVYILDLAGSLPSALDRLAMADINPKELLWGILLSLSRMRGTRACLLPELLERSKNLLTMDRPTANVSLTNATAEEQDPVVQFETETEPGPAFGLQPWD